MCSCRETATGRLHSGPLALCPVGLNPGATGKPTEKPLDSRNLGYNNPNPIVDRHVDDGQIGNSG